MADDRPLQPMRRGVRKTYNVADHGKLMLCWSYENAHTNLCLTAASLITGRPALPACGEEMWLVRLVPITNREHTLDLQPVICSRQKTLAQSTSSSRRAAVFFGYVSARHACTFAW